MSGKGTAKQRKNMNKLMKKKLKPFEKLKSQPEWQRKFDNRKQTLMSKAQEMEASCGVKVAVVIHTPLEMVHYYTTDVEVHKKLISSGLLGNKSFNLALLMPDIQLPPGGPNVDASNSAQSSKNVIDNDISNSNATVCKKQIVKTLQLLRMPKPNSGSDSSGFAASKTGSESKTSFIGTSKLKATRPNSGKFCPNTSDTSQLKLQKAINGQKTHLKSKIATKKLRSVPIMTTGKVIVSKKCNFVAKHQPDVKRTEERKYLASSKIHKETLCVPTGSHQRVNIPLTTSKKTIAKVEQNLKNVNKVTKAESQASSLSNKTAVIEKLSKLANPAVSPEVLPRSTKVVNVKATSKNCLEHRLSGELSSRRRSDSKNSRLLNDKPSTSRKRSKTLPDSYSFESSELTRTASSQEIDAPRISEKSVKETTDEASCNSGYDSASWPPEDFAEFNSLQEKSIATTQQFNKVEEKAKTFLSSASQKEFQRKTESSSTHYVGRQDDCRSKNRQVASKLSAERAQNGNIKNPMEEDKSRFNFDRPQKRSRLSYSYPAVQSKRRILESKDSFHSMQLSFRANSKKFQQDVTMSSQHSSSMNQNHYSNVGDNQNYQNKTIGFSSLPSGHGDIEGVSFKRQEISSQTANCTSSREDKLYRKTWAKDVFDEAFSVKFLSSHPEFKAEIEHFQLTRGHVPVVPVLQTHTHDHFAMLLEYLQNTFSKPEMHEFLYSALNSSKVLNVRKNKTSGRPCIILQGVTQPRPKTPITSMKYI